MKFKKLMSIAAAAAMAVTSLTGAMSFTASAEEVTMNDCFTFTYSSAKGIYNAKFNKNDYQNVLQTLGTTELIIPDTYDDGQNGEKKVELSLTGFNTNSIVDDVVTKIVFNSNISSYTASRPFCGFSKLDTVVFKYPGTDLKLGNVFSETKDALKKVEIYALGFNSAFNNAAFDGFSGHPESKIYVTSDDVKDQLFNILTKSSNPISKDQIEVMKSELPKPTVEITCEDITFGKKGGFEPTVTVKLNGDAMQPQPETTITLYKNEDCTQTYDGAGGYKNDKIPVGTYYLKATVAATEEYQAGFSDPLKVEVKEAVIDKTNLNAAIEAANSFKQSAVENDYDAKAWDAVFSNLTGALNHAQVIADDTLNKYTQDNIDEATTALNKALETLKQSPADTTEPWTELQGIITNIESNRGDYTSESYAKLESVLNEAKALSKETATKTKIDNMIKKVKDTINNSLVGAVPAGEPFVKLYKNGKVANIFNGKADESMAGAVSVKFTFDCAEDTNFQYGAIELTATVNGKKNYNQFTGSSATSELGSKNCQVVLDLANPIEEGQNCELTGFTYASLDASDYVFAITKVEFIDAKGHILKTINDATFAREDLAKVIESAETLKADDYTADSYANLTKAIEEAKALKDDATATEIKAAKDAITDAVKGLVKKSEVKPGDTSGKPADKTPSPAKVKTKSQQNAEAAMKQAKITKLTVKSKAKKKITVTWKKVSKAKGYQVQVSTNKKFKKSKIVFTKNTKNKKLVIKRLKSKKTYFVRVRAYATYKDSKGATKKAYSAWNKKVRKVKVK